MNSPVFDSPEAVEEAYVRAFQAADLDAMMDLWADEEDIVCTHPIAGRQQQGRAAVLEGWIMVFARALDVELRLAGVRRMRVGELAIHCGEEHLLRLEDGSVRGINNFTNVYKRTAQGWKMILHHASPGPKQSQPAARPGETPPELPGSHLH